MLQGFLPAPGSVYLLPQAEPPVAPVESGLLPAKPCLAAHSLPLPSLDPGLGASDAWRPADGWDGRWALSQANMGAWVGPGCLSS